MIRAQLVVGMVALLVARAAVAVPVAERITAGNAVARLFGGSDAIGGVGDWYVSNGVVEAIIDDVGPQEDLVPLLGSAAPPRQSAGARAGGTLVDLGLVGHDNDQFQQTFQVSGLNSANFVEYRQVAAAVVADAAIVRVTGVVHGFDQGATPIAPEDLEVVTDFSASGTDRFLTLTTTITNRHPTNPAAGLGTMLDPIIWTQKGPVPFSPLPERGFRHGILDLANPLVAVEVPAFAAGPGNLRPSDGPLDPLNGKPAGEVSYGLLGMEVSVDQDGDGGAPPVVTTAATLFGVTNNTTTALGPLPATGALQPGGILRYVRRLYVGDHDDVASVANLMLPVIAARAGFATGTISGDVDADDAPAVAASITAVRVGGPATPFADGAPITQVRTQDDGTFTGVVLPEGTYDLEVRAPERDTVTVSGVVVAAGSDTQVDVPKLTALGTVRLRALEPRAGRDRALPARIVFTGVDGTPDPNFRHDFDASLIDPGGGPDTDLHPETFGGGPAQGNVVVLGLEPVTVQVRPGSYELVATHGPEYGVQRRRLQVKAGRRQKATFHLRHLLDPDDALSADFHVHSARSFDASAPLVDRVVSFAAEGVEVMVATDHDMHTDYAPVIASLGLEGAIASIIGDEITTAVANPPVFPSGIGHLNGWPVAFDPSARKRGAIDDEFVAPNVLYSRLRAHGARIVQYNHPRDTLSGLASIGFFTNIGYDPDLPIDQGPNALLLDRDVLGPGRSGVMNPDGTRNIDFDTIEVANGLDVDSILEVRRDWLSLLNQTDFTTVPFIAGTAVSDSHRVTVETPGYCRTYVSGVGDDPAALDRAQLDARVKAGAMVGTNGPMLSVRLERDDASAAAGPGEQLTTSTGAVALVVRVDAVPWIPVDEVRVIANGFVVQRFDAASSPAVRAAPRNPYSRSPRSVRRFEARIPLVVSVDTYVVVEAGASLDAPPAPPDPAARLVPRLVPFAFANPIFVDLGGDGFVPPGLPVMATASGAGEMLPTFAQIVWPGAPPAVPTGRRGVRVPTGPEQRARLARERRRHTASYFPLDQLRLPDPTR